MTRIGLLMLALLSSPAHAGDEIDEATKITALKLGYALNGNSMVRWGSIDLTVPDLAPKANREVLPKQKERFKGK